MLLHAGRAAERRCMTDTPTRSASAMAKSLERGSDTEQVRSMQIGWRPPRLLPQCCRKSNNRSLLRHSQTAARRPLRFDCFSGESAEGHGIGTCSDRRPFILESLQRKEAKLKGRGGLVGCSPHLSRTAAVRRLCSRRLQRHKTNVSLTPSYRTQASSEATQQDATKTVRTQVPKTRLPFCATTCCALQTVGAVTHHRLHCQAATLH